MINHVESGCLIPFFQSLIVGVLTGLTAIGLVLWIVTKDARWGGLFISAGAALWWFTGSIQHHRRALYGEFEEVAPQLLPAEASTVRVEFHDERQILFAELPATPAQLRDLSTGLLAGVAFSEAAWIGAGRPFTRSQFQGIRAEFIARGWLRQRNPDYPNQGCELSPAGKAVCRELSAKGRL